MARILAVDPGEKRIGLAISDPSGTIARPLEVVEHISRERDAQAIARRAEKHEAELIVVGVALDQDGQVGFQARRSQRLVHALRAASPLPVEVWDESGTTLKAKALKGSDELLDARAAAFLLQDFLDSAADNASSRTT